MVVVCYRVTVKDQNCSKYFQYIIFSPETERKRTQNTTTQSKRELIQIYKLAIEGAARSAHPSFWAGACRINRNGHHDFSAEKIPSIAFVLVGF